MQPIEKFIEKGKLNLWPQQVIIHTDGASRGNPGPAGIGLAVYSSEGEIIYEYGASIGENTNNFAEYLAVVRALEIATEKGVRQLIIRSDSQLLVRQLTGEYKVKSETLSPLHNQCINLVKKFSRVSFEHVRRELNKKADEMANLALDQVLLNSRIF